MATKAHCPKLKADLCQKTDEGEEGEMSEDEDAANWPAGGSRKPRRDAAEMPASSRRLSLLSAHVSASPAAAPQEEEARQGGFGLLSSSQPPFFQRDDVDGIAAFFDLNGFAVIRDALPADDVAFLNSFYDDTQAACPRAWGMKEQEEEEEEEEEDGGGGVERRKRAPQHHVAEAGRIYSQPLLDHPELDRFCCHPGSFPSVDRVLGGQPRYSEFNLRESPEGAGRTKMHFHHDRVLESRLHRPAGHIIDDVCAIHYLTDVTPATPSFCVVPLSGRYPSIEEARSQLGVEGYTEQPIFGPAGTCVLYDIAIYHTRLDGTDEKGRLRRTMHQYFARGGWLGNRPPTPTLTDWNLIPRRLALSPDRGLRRFFSHWNTAQCEWAADGFSLAGRARHPRAVGVDFLGFRSRAEQEKFLRELEVDEQLTLAASIPEI